MPALPKPGSPELNDLGFSVLEREIYRLLFETRGTPLSIAQIRRSLRVASGTQEHLNRRLRELYREFDIERKRVGSVTTYELLGRLPVPRAAGRIDKSVRAYVLRNQRCDQCGRTPSAHNVVLHVDHKIPKEWGGTDEIGNLQALCAECNEGKKNYYATYDRYAPQLREAVGHDEPHRRIGELLKAFDGEPVRSDLIERVANAKQYQEDWQKRLRELRLLGWKIKAIKRKEGDRVVAHYELQEAQPWPVGGIAAEIRSRERARRAAKK
jgi:5-methylcytosine-specific restriction endonuclease McrA